MFNVTMRSFSTLFALGLVVVSVLMFALEVAFVFIGEFDRFSIDKNCS